MPDELVALAAAGIPQTIDGTRWTFCPLTMLDIGAFKGAAIGWAVDIARDNLKEARSLPAEVRLHAVDVAMQQLAAAKRGTQADSEAFGQTELGMGTMAMLMLRKKHQDIDTPEKAFAIVGQLSPQEYGDLLTGLNPPSAEKN